MKTQSNSGITSRVVRMDRLDPQERDRIVEELIALDQEVFIDKAPDKTREKYRGDHSDECWIMILRDEEKLIGYNCIRVTFLTSDGGRFALWNSRSAMHGDYRGLRKAGNFPLLFFYRFRLRFPFLPIRSLITLIHPSSFKLFSDRIPNLYPSYRRVLGNKEEARFQRAFDRMGLETVPGKERFVVKDNTITRTDPIEREFWARSHDPSLEFFHQHNHEYLEGQAITTWFSIGVLQILHMTVRQFRAMNLFQKLGKRLGLSSGRVSRKNLLKTVPLFAGLPDGELNEILKHAKTRWLKHNEVLIRQGERSRKLFIPLKGSLMVDQESEGADRLAQLPVGEPAGEFGFLLGTPRMATLHAFRSTQVLSIDLDDLTTHIDRLPQLETALLKLIGERVALNLEKSRKHERFQEPGVLESKPQ